MGLDTVGLDSQEHVTGAEADRGIRMRCGIVEEVGEIPKGFLHGVGLLGSEGAKDGEHGQVDGAGLEQEHTDDFLEEFFVSWCCKKC